MTKTKKTNAATGGVAEDIAAITDRVCAEHLDSEYGALCRKAIGRLARTRGRCRRRCRKRRGDAASFPISRNRLDCIDLG